MNQELFSNGKICVLGPWDCPPSGVINSMVDQQAAWTRGMAAHGRRGVRWVLGLLALIKHRFHVPTYQVNVRNNYVSTLSTNLFPRF
jgi:hypothetical protein